MTTIASRACSLNCLWLNVAAKAIAADAPQIAVEAAASVPSVSGHLEKRVMKAPKSSVANTPPIIMASRAGDRSPSSRFQYQNDKAEALSPRQI